MPVSKFIRYGGQIYRLAQQGQDVSVLKPADYKLCRFVTDSLGGSNSRMIHDCTELVDHFLELGYEDPANPHQQEAFFEEAFASGWLTGQVPQQYAASVQFDQQLADTAQYIRVRGQLYRRV